MKNRVELIQEDITKMKVDSIVNAANNSLLGGGGVDGAIHRAAGAELLKACKMLNGCETGNAKITKAYNLPSKFVIHTVGPIWENGSHNENELLASCYKKSLDLAVENNLKSIAFPNISTGVYGFPKKEAAEIAIKTVFNFLKINESIEKVYFVVFDDENYEIYSKIFQDLDLLSL